MPHTVAVTHPVFARYVPPGARKPVTGSVAIATPVTLVEADPDSFRHIRSYDFTHAVHEHAGRLWVSFVGSYGKADVEELAAYLSGAVDAKGGPFGSHRAFAGTPLLSMDAPGFLGRGIPEADIAGSRQVLADAASASARVRSYLDGNVRIAGGRAYVRSDLLACADWFASNVYAVHNPGSMRGSAHLAHIADFQVAWDHMRGAGHGHSPAMDKARKAFFREYRDIPSELVPRDADEAPTLCYLVRLVEWAIGRSKEVKGLSGDTRRALAALAEANARLMFDGTTGGIEPDRVHEVLAFHDGFREAAGERAWDLRPPSLLPAVRYVEEVLAPRIRAKAIDAGDAEALSALGPVS